MTSLYGFYMEKVSSCEFLQESDKFCTFFNRMVKSIEVVIHESLLTVYFRTPLMCEYVMGHLRKEIEENIELEPPEVKVQDFLERTTSGA